MSREECEILIPPYVPFIPRVYKYTQKFSSIFITIFFFWRRSLSLLECSGMIMVHSDLHILASSNFHVSASQVAGITGVCHHTQLIFAFLVGTDFHHIGQAGLTLLASSDLPMLASQSSGIIGVSHCT